MRYFLKIWDVQKINELAYQSEKIIHGHPSGADNTTCCFGGLVWYRKETEFLKSIFQLPVSSYKIPQFILIDTGLPKEGTSQMIGLVKKNYDKNPRLLDQIFTDQENQTKNVLISFKTGNFTDLKTAIIKGERNLEKIGVVSPSSQKLIKEIENIGGAAKVCGGGGKIGPTGFLLACHQNPQKILHFAQNIQMPAFYAKIGSEGVRVENNSALKQ